MGEAPEQPKLDPLVPWLDRTIEQLRATTTDSEMRLALQEACAELDEVDEAREIRKLLALNLRQAAEMLTRAQADDRLIPNLQKMRDDLAKGPPAGGKPGCTTKGTMALLLVLVPALVTHLLR